MKKRERGGGGGHVQILSSYSQVFNDFWASFDMLLSPFNYSWWHFRLYRVSLLCQVQDPFTTSIYYLVRYIQMCALHATCHIKINCALVSSTKGINKWLSWEFLQKAFGCYRRTNYWGLILEFKVLMFRDFCFCTLYFQSIGHFYLDHGQTLKS